MKRRIIRGSSTPVKASYDVPNLGKFAENVADDLEELLDRTTRVANLSEILSADDIETLSEAYDILLLFCREYQDGNYTESSK